MFNKKDKRFEVKLNQTINGISNVISIIVDKETGVNYILINSTSITPLLNENGNVVIDKK